MAAILALAVLSVASRASAYRTLATLEGSSEPIVWDAPPTVALDSASFPDGSRAGIAVELEEAVGVWNATACAGPLLSIDHGQPTPEILVRYEADWAGFDDDAAATTDLVIESGPGGPRLVAAIIHLDGRREWVTSGEARRGTQRDARLVLVHELGHSLGLAHVCEPDDPALSCGAEHLGITMHPLYEQGGDGRLSTDDLDGLCSLYSSETPEVPSCNDTDECYEGERCTAGMCQADSLYGAACRFRSDCVSTYCIEDAASPAGGICTRDCEDDAECPSGAACVPVDEVEIHVCQPRASSGGCSVVPRGRGRAAGGPLAALFVVVGASVFVRRRHAAPEPRTRP